MIVAIHQPNYAPWLGYFAKIARADIFVFLDDAQFSKNSYINRVQVRNGDKPHWLTIPVKVHLGDRINAISPAHPDWKAKHCSSLQNFYRTAPAFRQEWPKIRALLEAAPAANIACINQHIIEGLASLLGLSTRFYRSSTIDTGKEGSDVRLASIVDMLAPGGTYLSGTGGQKYQMMETFDEKGIQLEISNFRHPVYAQRAPDFIPGLSVLDAIFELGLESAASLVSPERS